MLSAQAISGYVNLEPKEDWAQELVLSQVTFQQIQGKSAIKPLAKVRVGANGQFKIDRKYFSDKNKIYRLHAERIRKIVNDTLSSEVTFLMSNKDRMVFSKGKTVFGVYTTTNQGDQEWRKMREFESSLVQQYLNLEDRIVPQKAYVKDSLQILMVKLIGIKQLAEKRLLDQDIAENPAYYVQVLGQFKESTIEPAEYWFLEKRLAYLTQESVQQELQTSRLIIIGLIVCLLGMGLAFVFLKRKPQLISPLSQREENIKNLILEGKSNKEIAEELYISLSTVKTHITHIYHKLQVAGRRELLQKSTGTST